MRPAGRGPPLRLRGSSASGNHRRSARLPSGVRPSGGNRHPVRRVHPRGNPGTRRDGDDVRRPGASATASRSHSRCRTSTSRRPRVHRAVPSGRRARSAAPPSEHRPDLRGRGARRAPLHRDGARSRNHAREGPGKSRACPFPARSTSSRGIALALDYAHMKGIVHRDLKPENVMVLPDGEVKVMDYGIARRMDVAGLTATDAYLGTPNYSAPESLVSVRGRPAVGHLQPRRHPLPDALGGPAVQRADPVRAAPQARLRALAGPFPPGSVSRRRSTVSSWS